MSPPDACFSFKRKGKCHQQYRCTYSSFLIKDRVPPLPSQSQHTASQPVRHHLHPVMCRQTPLTCQCPLESSLDWCHACAGLFCSQKIYIHPWSKGTAEEYGRRREITSVFKLRGEDILLCPSASHVTRMSGWPVRTLSQNLEITKLFACWIAIYILYK